MKRACSLVVGPTLVSLCAMLGVACSSDGSSGGGNGGSSSSSGGATGQGGSSTANGGANNANGGSSNANGGANNANGGSSNANGGANNANGGAGSGGASSGGAANGGSTSGGSSNNAGASSGGSSNGGSANGGNANGGAAAGNAGSGTGGSSAGASNGGASQSGGAGGNSNGGGGTSAPVFQDDFEGSALNTKWVSKINGGGMFALDTSQKHGGSKSLHVTTNSGYSTLLAIEDSSVFPAPNNTFYGRVWLRVPTLPGNAHVIWMEAGDVTNDTHEVRIGMNLGYLQTNLYYQGEVDLRDPSATLTAAMWQCIEFKMGNDELVVWLNGTQSTAVSTTNWAQVGNGQNGGGQAKSNWSPTYKSFRIGWELNAGTEIWFDDVALGYSRIGCE